MVVVIAEKTLRVTVADRSSELPAQRGSSELAECGRGLQLVEAFTHRWGAEPQKLGKRVWFELDGVA